MNREAAFDALAPGYDTSFSHSLTGREQRLISRKHLEGFISGKGCLRILEINCGTGEDALWLASLGHEVMATDQSEAMIREAKQKRVSSPDASVHFSVCGFGDLMTAFHDRQFDLIFSNFAGLNCTSPEELQELGLPFHHLLHSQGRLVVVLFGKYCWMETFYFLLKADFRKAFRRWSDKEVRVRLKKDIYQPVNYYSVRRFVRTLRHFRLLKKFPVGLFIPPSYMESLLQKHSWLFHLLKWMENRVGQFGPGSEFADHTCILLQKKEI